MPRLILLVLVFTIKLTECSSANAESRYNELVRDIFYEGTIVLDPDAALDYRQAYEKALAAVGTPRKKVPAGGNVYWLMAQVENTDAPSNWWVEVFAARSDYVDLFVLNNGELQAQQRTGLIPIATEETSLKGMGSLILKFDIPKRQKRTLLLRVQSRSLINYTIKAGPEVLLHNQRSNRHFVVYMLMGGMFALIFYNLFLGVGLRELDYFLYSIHGIFYFAFFFNSYGFAASYLGLTNHPWITVYTGLGLEIGGLLFIRNFLRVGEWSPLLNRLMQFALLVIVFLALIAPLLGLGIMSQVWMVAYVLVPILVILASIRGIFKGIRQSWYVLIGCGQPYNVQVQYC